MALAIDASTPALASTATAVSVTTASFTPPSGSLVVLMYAANGLSGADTSVASVTNTGTSIAWTRQARKNNNSSSTGGAGTNGGAEIWTGVGNGGAITVTVTGAASGSGTDKAMQAVVFTGADTTNVTHVAAGSSASLTVPSVTLTSCAAGSHVVAVNSDWNQSGLGTFPTGQTKISEYNNTSQVTDHFWRTTSTLSSAGSQTMNQTAPTQQWDMVVLEVVAASSGTPVSLTGAVAAVTTAAPAGTVATQKNIALTGAVASVTTAAPAGTVAASGPVSLTGAVASVTTASPAGTVSATSPIALTGAVAGVSTAAPAGTLSLSVSLTASPASVLTGAPAGTVSVQTNVTLTGVVAAVSTAAPAGTITLSVSMTGPVAAVSIGAPAGTVLAQGPISLTGQVASVTISAPAGTVAAGSGPVTVSGPVATLTISALAGTVTAIVTVTYTFTPPTTPMHYGDWPTAPLMSRIKYPTGGTLLKSNGFYTLRFDAPSQTDINNADVVYLGGHTYTITKAEADALTAAGYGANIVTS